MKSILCNLLTVLVSMIVISHLSISTALSDDLLEAEIAPGVADLYELEEVCPGFTAPAAPAYYPTSMVFGREPHELYIAYSSFFLPGKVLKLDLQDCVATEVATFDPTMVIGLAVHPNTKELYVGQGTKISVIDDGGGMYDLELDGSIDGAMGLDFDTRGNLYVSRITVSGPDGPATGLTGILKITPDGHVSDFAFGTRVAYDVAVGKEKGGKAVFLYSGDNGTGNDCVPGPDDPTPLSQDCADNLIMYYDELNRIWEGKFYGWPEGFTGSPKTDNIAPLWNFEEVSPLDLGLDPAHHGLGRQAPVPTGIDTAKKWGEHKNPVFLAFYNCETLEGHPDHGTVDMFTGHDLQNRTRLVWHIDGAIEVRMGPDKKLYIAEWQTGRIYRAFLKHGG